MTDKSVSVDFFKKRSKFLFKKLQSGDVEARALMDAHLIKQGDITLMNVQYVVAKLSGFKNWGTLLQAEPVEIALAMVLEKEPQLNSFGMGNFERRLSPQVARETLLKNKAELRNNVALVAKTIVWLEDNIQPINTINTSNSSYGLKHQAEKKIGYITNGMFIAAAMIAGYKYKIFRNSPNVHFGMSKKSIKNLN